MLTLRLYRQTKRSNTLRRLFSLDAYIISRPLTFCKSRKRILRKKKPGRSRAISFCACTSKQKHDNVSIRVSFTPLKLNQEAWYWKRRSHPLDIYYYSTFPATCNSCKRFLYKKKPINVILELTAVFIRGIIIMKKYIESANHTRLALFLCYVFPFLYLLIESPEWYTGQNGAVPESGWRAAPAKCPWDSISRRGSNPLCSAIKKIDKPAELSSFSSAGII